LTQTLLLKERGHLAGECRVFSQFFGLSLILGWSSSGDGLKRDFVPPGKDKIKSR
jgi:hypothetical protein